ncbi:MAG: ATP-binding protein [Thermodesulfobacteriota bacterium]
MTLRDADGRRPSPQALLTAAERAERTRLRVFVGAAPGVGKTYAMLEAARERRREGVDVVVGVVETHGRPETEALLEGLEVIPRRRIEYRGQALREMDLDAILARRPEIVLVDELAHTNAPGSRHPKRYSDVEELFEAGIEVYTTVNIQHLESLNDVVARITGVRVRETVPDVILERADEIKLVDLPPEDLIKRLHEGKVYVPAQAQRAIENYFKPGNLTALRELALRHTAERVDDEVQRYMQAHAIPGPWAVSERILVGVSEGPFGERLVRAARRMAGRRRAEWLAVFVESAAFHRRPAEERERVARALRLAERLGGEPVTIPGRDVATALVDYARQRNVTEIILGKPIHPWWRELWKRSPIDDVIRRSGDIEVRVIAGEKAPDAGAERRTPPARGVAAPWRYAVSLALVAAAAGTAALMQWLFLLPDPSMIFLTGVLFAAVWGGLGPSLVASVVSVLVYDLFFVEPTFTLTVTKPHDVVLMCVFLIVAVLVSHLTARARDEAEAARLREARTASLYAFSRELAAAVGIEDLVPLVLVQIARLMDADVVLLLPDRDRLVPRGSHPPDLVPTAADLAAASWVRQHDEAAGAGTDTLPGSEWTFEPLDTARGVVGVIGVRVHGQGERALPLERRQLLQAMARQAAIAIERTRIDVVLEEKAKTEAVMEAIEDGLAVLDPQRIVVHVNEVACAILEVDRDQVIGTRFDELASRHPHYLRVREALREFEQHPEREADRVEIALFMRGRDHFFVLRPTSFRTRDGQPAGVILALQDVTYFRDQEARREHLVATLSHELGTPITSLRMAIELLERDGRRLDEEQRELIKAAHEDVLRLQDVSRRFLDLARSRATAIALERGDIEVAHVVDRVVRIFAAQAREKGVAIETSTAAAGRLAGDETKLTWALSNLVANALRYTPGGGRIALEARGVDGEVEVSVADTGPGIPADQQERVFERFAQSAVGGEIGGAGLGLAIVRDIVQAHGGRILLESAPGKGTRFTIRLPRC